MIEEKVLIFICHKLYDEHFTKENSDKLINAPVVKEGNAIGVVSMVSDKCDYAEIECKIWNKYISTDLEYYNDIPSCITMEMK